MCCINCLLYIAKLLYITHLDSFLKLQHALVATLSTFDDCHVIVIGCGRRVWRLGILVLLHTSEMLVEFCNY